MSKDKFDYFKAFHELTDKAIEEADVLLKIFENFDGSDKLRDDMQMIHKIENEGDKINHKVFKNAAIDFITPIDREDLLSLSCNLDNILDQIEACIQDMYMYDVRKLMPEAIDFAKLVIKACKVLHKCTGELPNYKKNNAKLWEYIVQVNDIEEEADLLYMKANRRLYTKEYEKAVKILV